MSDINIHDRYIYLQVMLKELESQGNNDKDFGFQYHTLSNKVNNIIGDAISQGMTEISEFQHLLRTVKEKKETE